MSDYVYQRQHLREWATKHIVEFDAHASGLLRSPFSTVFFGDRKALRFSGSLPDGGQSPLPYTFYFYPPNEPAVEITDIGGNLFVPPYCLPVSFSKPGVLSGIVILRIETDDTNRRFIATEVDCKTPDGTAYKGTYYLFTLPPRSRVGIISWMFGAFVFGFDLLWKTLKFLF